MTYALCAWVNKLARATQLYSPIEYALSTVFMSFKLEAHTLIIWQSSIDSWAEAALASRVAACCSLLLMAWMARCREYCTCMAMA